MIRRNVTTRMLAVVGTLCIVQVTAGQLLLQQPSSARECALCHLDWVKAFEQPGTLTLIDKPANDIVNAPETCLGCHDASVGDSRRKVWLEHGHQTGIAPSEGMNVPDELPLVDGKLACSTCHSAHGMPPEGREPTLADVFFLRIDNEDSALCTACHTNLAQGTEHGFHPVNVELEAGLPELLTKGGAHLGTKNRQMICTSCHVPHGAREEALMAVNPNANDFCLSCHENMHPARWREGTPHTHPMSAGLETPALKQAIEALGTRAGEGNTLVCSSCHIMHHAPASGLLAETLEESQLCMTCHQDQQALFDTVHNLANSAPEALNAQGKTAVQAGACGACHGVHEPARDFEVTALDPTGTCATCHRQDQCAEKVPLQSNDHPMPAQADDALRAKLASLLPAKSPDDHQGMTCFTCHNPHANPHHAFLRETPDQLCGHCHADQAQSLAGVHDFTSIPDARNMKGLTPTETGKCGTCHAVHGAAGPVLWAAARIDDPTPDALCLNCHLAEDLPAHVQATSLRHPSGKGLDLSALPKDHWPLYDEQAHASSEGVLACSTCHDVHGDSTQVPGLLRHPASAGGNGWCLDCHTDMSAIAHSMHRDEALAAMVKRMNPEGQPARCAPCHRVHDSETPIEMGMWAAPLGGDEHPTEMRQCLGCHGDGGEATQMTLMIHPTVPMRNSMAEGEPGFLPLIDEQGHMGAAGRITCKTCHLPHGRMLEGEAVTEAATGRELDQRGTLTRAYRSPNVCSDCHGLQGLGYYLYYHFPAKRARLTLE